MKITSISNVKPKYFEKDGTDSILSFRLFQGELFIISYPYNKSDKKKFSFTISRNIDENILEIYKAIQKDKRIENFDIAIDKNFDEITFFDANHFDFNLLTDMINKSQRDNSDIIVVSRRDGLNYRYSETNILGSFKDSVIAYGPLNETPKEIFGDYFYAAKFKNIGDLKTFREFVEEISPIKSSKRRKSFMLTGEDIDMFHEREQESKSKSKEAICDTHMDGA